MLSFSFCYASTTVSFKLPAVGDHFLRPEPNYSAWWQEAHGCE